MTTLGEAQAASDPQAASACFEEALGMCDPHADADLVRYIGAVAARD